MREAYLKGKSPKADCRRGGGLFDYCVFESENQGAETEYLNFKKPIAVK